MDSLTNHVVKLCSACELGSANAMPIVAPADRLPCWLHFSAFRNRTAPPHNHHCSLSLPPCVLHMCLESNHICSHTCQKAG